MGTTATIELMLININNMTAIITTSIVNIIISAIIITSIVEIIITTTIITSIIKMLAIANIKKLNSARLGVLIFVIVNISVMLVVMPVAKGW